MCQDVNEKDKITLRTNLYLILANILILFCFRFPEHVESGLIEVISPSPSYYPNMDSLKITLGDPVERVR